MEFRYFIVYSRQLAHFPAVLCNNTVTVPRKISSAEHIRKIEQVVHAAECESLANQMKGNGFPLTSSRPEDNTDLRITIVRFELLN